MKNKVFLIAYYSIIQLNIKKIKNEDLESKKIIQYLDINSRQHYNEILKAAIVFALIPIVSGFFFVKLFTKIVPIIKPEDYKLNL